MPRRANRVLALSGALCLLLGQDASAQRAPVVVTAKLVLSTDAVHRGTTVQAAAVAEVAPGYHINAHQPTLDYLIPTELKLEAGKAFRVQRVAYPKGNPRKFAWSGTPLSVYQGKIEIGVVLAVSRAAAVGEYPLKGELTYQACNDRSCLPPAAAAVELSVKVVSAHTPLHRINAGVFRALGSE